MDEDRVHISKKKRELLCKEGIYFSVLLWPPVQSWFDEIEDELKKNYGIAFSEDFEFEEHGFVSFVRGVYDSERIEPWMVEVKLHAMRAVPKRVRFLALEVSNPEYRLYEVEGRLSSQAVRKIKETCRLKYAPRVSNYIRDIVIHAGNNQIENAKIFNLLRVYKFDRLVKSYV